MKKQFSGIMVTLLLVSMLALIFNIQSVKSAQEPPAVEWQRTYGTSEVEQQPLVIQTTDGGYLAAGKGKGGIWLLKIDKFGNPQWDNVYGQAQAVGVVEVDNGNYVVLATQGPAPSKFFKVNAQGELLWTQYYDPGPPTALALTDDGGFILVGPLKPAFAHWWLLKVNSNGIEEWRKYYDAYWPAGVVQTDDGGYAVAGEKGNGDTWLLKVNHAGEHQWNKTYGGNGRDNAGHIVQTSNGEYILAGSFEDGRFFWAFKTDAFGNVLWDKTYGEPGVNVGCSSLALTRGHGYIFAGSTWSPFNGLDVFVVKTDSDGNEQWRSSYGGGNDDWADSVLQINDRGYMIGATTVSFGAGDRDFWLIKLAPHMEIPATIDIDPNTLNLKSKGKWITGYIELPGGYDVADINVSSILVNGTIPVCPCAPTTVGDYDSDGIPDLMVKFFRLRVVFFILCRINITELLEEGCVTVTLTITGKLNDGTPFEGSDTIKIIMPMPRHCKLREFY